MKKSLGLGFLIMLSGTMFSVGCEKPVLLTDKSKFSYSLGVQMANNLKAQDIDFDEKAFAAGVGDALADRKMQLSEEERIDALRKVEIKGHVKAKSAVEKNQIKGRDFLEKNARMEGVKTTPTGLQYRVISLGKGRKPKPADMVEINFRIKLLDGNEVDSSFAKNAPAQLVVQSLNPGWAEGMQLLPEGSKFELVVPSELAYGSNAIPNVPAYSVLIYEIELLQVVKNK